MTEAAGDDAMIDWTSVPGPCGEPLHWPLAPAVDDRDFLLPESQLSAISSRTPLSAPYLEEYGLICVSPEVGDWVAAVTPAGQHFQSTTALAIGTGFSLLLLSRLVADRRSQGNAVTIVQYASL